jgi:hypothetical protein
MIESHDYRGLMYMIKGMYEEYKPIPESVKEFAAGLESKLASSRDDGRDIRIAMDRSELTKLLRKLSSNSLCHQKEKFEAAALRDYLVWLEGYLLDGGEPTEYIDREWREDHDWPFESDMLTAKENFTTNGECGAYARSIIVPYGVDWDISHGLGHSNLYYYDGKEFGVIGGWVPVYSDSAFEEIPQLRDFIEEQKQEWKMELLELA